MDAETAARFDAIEARFTDLVQSLAQQFDAMQRYVHRTGQDLREVMELRFAQVDQRFEQFDRRFDEVDRRFAEMDSRVDGLARAEAVERRFDHERALVAGQFEAMQKHMDERFDELRIALDHRFDNHERRLRRLEGTG